MPYDLHGMQLALLLDDRTCRQGVYCPDASLKLASLPYTATRSLKGLVPGNQTENFTSQQCFVVESDGAKACVDEKIYSPHFSEVLDRPVCECNKNPLDYLLLVLRLYQERSEYYSEVVASLLSVSMFTSSTVIGPPSI